MKPSNKFSAKKHDAEITLYGDIGFDITAKEFSDELNALDKPDSITIRINSFGGDIFEGVTIYSRLIDSGANITVKIDGIAASAASVMQMAANEIHIAEAGFLMIHDAWAGTVGNASAMMKMAGRLEAVSEQMASVYQRRTGQSMAAIREFMAAETEFNAAQAVEFGFATEIFEADRLGAHYDPERHNFKRPPSVTLSPRLAETQRMVAEMQIQTIR